MDLKMRNKLVDFLRQDRRLNLGRTGIRIMRLELLDNLILVLLTKHMVLLIRVLSSPFERAGKPH